MGARRSRSLFGYQQGRQGAVWGFSRCAADRLRASDLLHPPAPCFSGPRCMHNAHSVLLAPRRLQLSGGCGEWEEPTRKHGDVFSEVLPRRSCSRGRGRGSSARSGSWRSLISFEQSGHDARRRASPHLPACLPACLDVLPRKAKCDHLRTRSALLPSAELLMSASSSSSSSDRCTADHTHRATRTRGVNDRSTASFAHQRERERKRNSVALAYLVGLQEATVTRPINPDRRQQQISHREQVSLRFTT